MPSDTPAPVGTAPTGSPVPSANRRHLDTPYDPPPMLSRMLRDGWDMQVSLTVDPAESELLWQVYSDSLAPVRYSSPARHVMERKDFDDLLANELVDKVVVRRRDDPTDIASLCMYTTDIDLVVQASPEYYATRFIDYAASGRLWYVVIVSVSPRHQGSPAAAAMSAHLGELAQTHGGVVALDFAGVNNALATALPRLGRSLGQRITATRLDALEYWAYEIEAR